MTRTQRIAAVAARLDELDTPQRVGAAMLMAYQDIGRMDAEDVERGDAAGEETEG